MKIKHRLEEVVKKNISIMISFFAALSLFGTSVFGKKILDDVEYGQYSLLVTLISIIYTVGLLGGEQLINRTSILKDHKLSLNIDACKLVGGVMVLITPLIISITIYMYSGYFENTDILLIVAISIISNIGYNFFRLTRSFVLSQTIQNLWKLCLLPSILILLVSDYSVTNVFLIVYCGLFFVLTCYLFFNNSKLCFSFNSQTEVLPLVYYAVCMLNIASLTFLAYGERIIIEQKFGLEFFSEYFYGVNIYLFPFLFFSNYIGFKRFVDYKVELTGSLYKSDLLKTCIFSLMIGGCIIIASELLFYLNILDVPENDIYNLKYILLLIGVLKMCYSIQSSVIGVILKSKDLFLINIAFLFLVFISINLVDISSIGYVVTFLCVMWVCRLILSNYFIAKRLL